MKIIYGILIGASLFVSGTAFAAVVKQTGIQLDTGATLRDVSVIRAHDYDKGVDCYIATRTSQNPDVAISCVK